MEAQIKSTMRYHHTPVRTAKIKKTDHIKSWQGCRGNGTLVHHWWECKQVQPLWRKVCQLTKKLNIHLPYNPDITFLGFTQEKESLSS